MRDAKKYAIRATRRPVKQSLVSSVVSVFNELGVQGYCYINFDAPFIEAVGKKLPRGVSKEDQAFIEVLYHAPSKVWIVAAGYVGRGADTFLWKTAEKPLWLKFFKLKAQNVSHYSPPPCTEASSSRA